MNFDNKPLLERKTDEDNAVYCEARLNAKSDIPRIAAEFLAVCYPDDWKNFDYDARLYLTTANGHFDCCFSFVYGELLQDNLMKVVIFNNHFDKMLELAEAANFPQGDHLSLITEYELWENDYPFEVPNSNWQVDLNLDELLETDKDFNANYRQFVLDMLIHRLNDCYDEWHNQSLWTFIKETNSPL